MDSKPIVTLEEAKEFLGVPDSATKLDLRYTMMIAAATEQIEQATGRLFTRQTITEFLTSRDNIRIDYAMSGDAGVGDTGLRGRVTPQTLYLKGVCVADDPAPQLWYDPYPVDDGSYGSDDLLTEGKDYVLDRETDTAVVYVGTRFHPRAFKVSYVAGFEVDATTDTLSLSAPDTLKMACLLQMQFLNVKLRDSNIGMGGERTAVVGSSGKSVGVFSKFLVASGLTPEAASLLRRYRRVGTGRG